VGTLSVVYFRGPLPAELRLDFEGAAVLRRSGAWSALSLPIIADGAPIAEAIAARTQGVALWLLAQTTADVYAVHLADGARLVRTVRFEEGAWVVARGEVQSWEAEAFGASAAVGGTTHPSYPALARALRGALASGAEQADFAALEPGGASAIVARPLGARRRLAAAALLALTASVVFATLGFARPPPDDGRTLLFVGATMAALGGAAVIGLRRVLTRVA
jgi:hypothetical protein